MHAVLRYGERRLSFKLGNKNVTVNLIKPDQHLLILIRGADSIYPTKNEEREIDSKELYINTGHSSFENMKKLLENAKRWDQT